MLEKALAWFYAREGKVTYSMENRNGPSSYDCSSSVYHALKEAGGFPASYWIGNTDTLYGHLEKNGWVQVPVDGNGNAQCQRGDIFIWGVRGNSGGAAGHCLPYDNTELLTPQGWKPLKDFKAGDSIIQFDNATHRLEPSKVKAITGPMEDDVYRRGNIEVTDGHRMLVKTVGTKGFIVKQWGNIKDKNGCVLPVAEANSGVEGDIRKLKDNEIKLLLAIQADGTFDRSLVRFHFKKQRKIDNIEGILKSLGLSYTVGAVEKDGAVRINTPRDAIKHLLDKYLPEKKFNTEWLSITQHQAEVIYDNIPLWDGSIKKSARVYLSSIESNVDIMQEALFLGGYRAHKRKEGSLFVLGFQKHKNAVHSGKYHLESDGEQHRKTIVGCVTVPSGFIVSRQFGVPTIVGNTGMFVDADNIINCRWGKGIVVDNHDWLWQASGSPNYVFYRYVGKPAVAVVSVGDSVSLPETYRADAVETHFGIKQIRTNFLSSSFDWEDNGVPVSVAVKTDKDGFRLSGDIAAGDNYRIPGSFTVTDTMVDDGHEYAAITMAGETVWVLVQKIIKGNPTPQPTERPVDQPKPKTPETEVPPNAEPKPLAPQISDKKLDEIKKIAEDNNKQLRGIAVLLQKIVDFLANLFKGFNK